MLQPFKDISFDNFWPSFFFEMNNVGHDDHFLFYSSSLVNYVLV